MVMQSYDLRPFRLAENYTAEDVTALFCASKSALLRLHANLEVEKQSLRCGDGKGGLHPFCMDELSEDDRSWISYQQKLVDRLNSALARFGYKL